MLSERQAKKYCYEDISLIENYELAIADKTQTWHCHHRVETIMNCGAEELIAQGCYENRPAHDLIFLTKGEHSRLHNTGKKCSEETCAKISAAQIGKHLTEETKAKLSAAHKGKKHSEETRAKMSKAQTGKKHSEETRNKLSAANKGKKLSEETRAKVSASRIGKHFWNNGTENKFCKECPGEGWVQGRL